jgi:hypothetical protein
MTVYDLVAQAPEWHRRCRARPSFIWMVPVGAPEGAGGMKMPTSLG